MIGLMAASSPVEIEAKADEAQLPDEARQAGLRLFHDLTSKLELAAIELETKDGEEWPRHRFYFGPKDGEIARLLIALQERPDAAEVTTSPPRDETTAGTLFIAGSDGKFAAVLVACANASRLHAIRQELASRLSGTEP